MSDTGQLRSWLRSPPRRGIGTSPWSCQADRDRVALVRVYDRLERPDFWVVAFDTHSAVRLLLNTPRGGTYL